MDSVRFFPSGEADCDSADEKDSELAFWLKIDAPFESVVDIDVDALSEAADIVDEKDSDTGRVAGGEEPPSKEDVSMSNPLALGESGCGNG